MDFSNLKRPLAALAACGFALTGSLAATLPAAAVDIQEVTSPGGIKALLVEDHTNPLISMKFAFKGAGSTQDALGKEGTANLMSGLLDEGAGDIESAEFQKRLDDTGVSMSYDASLDNFTGSFRTITEFDDEAFNLLRLSLTEPRFDPEPVDRIRGQIATGIIANRNDPREIASRTFRETVFAGHPYARPVEGTVDTLKAVTPDDLKAFRQRTFAKDDLYVGVVGDITPEALGKRLDEVFGALPEKADLKTIPQTQPIMDKTVPVDLAVPQTVIQFALPGVMRDDDDFFAAYLMNHILGGGSFTSRLYTEIREKRGLAYGASSFLASYDHAAVLGISTATRSDKAAETVRLIREEIEKMAKDGPTDEELKKAKDYVKGSYVVRNLDSSLAVASTLVGIQLDDLGIDYIDRRQKLIDEVTMDQVKAAAKKLLSVEPTVITVGSAGA
ncbi:pitrilysin family protein [Aurantimonas sp. VKM B-3413]|uniref:M16 family metallopeptidase n=1 Tax=Aurantimonas sp. VKM B-3413 TaxID=2779401 RepID=UPI001E4A5285|nr:pitrilysin family protein [Aurantimonas sp. VKM B-3413]MCB8836961.1 insulinase family protein [Aurantimonas sp. VKM B-3413]